MPRRSDHLETSFTAADLADGMVGAATASGRVAESRRAVLLVATMAAALLLWVVSGLIGFCCGAASSRRKAVIRLGPAPSLRSANFKG